MAATPKRQLPRQASTRQRKLSWKLVQSVSSIEHRDRDLPTISKHTRPKPGKISKARDQGNLPEPRPKCRKLEGSPPTLNNEEHGAAEVQHDMHHGEPRVVSATAAASSGTMTASCVGLEQAYLEPMNPEDVCDDQDGEVESNTTESWNVTEASMKKAYSILDGASQGVSDNTYQSYIRLIKAFDGWLIQRNLLKAGSTIFDGFVSERIPELIAMWILDECDEIALDGSKKPPTMQRSSYSHAMKMRAAMTYGFGRLRSCGNSPWHLNNLGQWQGNPSISVPVSRYMVSLRRRKVRSGEAAVSSRAVTPDLLRALWDINHRPENWSIKPYAPQPRLRSDRDLQSWGGGRTRRLLHAIYSTAFWCLLRFDEVLRIKMHDLEVVSGTCVKLTLPFRKTDQFGSLSLSKYHITGGYNFADIKPFYLHLMPNSDAYICPVRALSEWISVCGYTSGHLFRRVMSGDRMDMSDRPISLELFLELFRNNLLDIGRDPWMYGTHSFRRGGCQWLSSGCRWPLRRICDWGGWSLDFSSMTIVKYLISWSDDPLESREDYLNPNRSPALRCYSCGRSCHCA